MLQVAFFVGAFFVGSVPFGYIVAKSKGIDIRKFGSGNIGATNVKRALGEKLGLLVLVLDTLKGFLSAFLATSILGSQELGFLVGLTAVLGHCFSPFLQFRGGKGISTGLGALLGAAWMVGVSSFVLFALTLALTRYVSVASIAAGASLVVFGWIYHQPQLMLTAFSAFGVFVILRHRANIGRLIKGAEPRFAWKNNPKDGPS